MMTTRLKSMLKFMLEMVSDRMKYNQRSYQAGGNYFGGVCINLLRHPAGWRAQEGYGEDSYLTG
jgi:hypothetical protein